IDGVETPTLAPAERLVSVKECNTLLGTRLSAHRIAALLEQMRFGAKPAGRDRVRVLVPCYRADIMHDWDIFEDVAIAYGYEHLKPTLPTVATIGKEHPVSALQTSVRAI